MNSQGETAWSTADPVLPYQVYLGIWTNWSRGSVLGQTLTCTRRNGDLIIAFTAFFIAFVGSRFWRISSIILHRSYSTDQPSGTVHHQRQIILRNTDSADAGLVKFAQLLWAWRKRLPVVSLVKILPAFIMALFCVVAFTIAGGYSSQITTSAGTEVLVDGANCDLLVVNRTYDSNILEINVKRLWNEALNYAQQCYNTESEGIFDCQGFVTERIPIFIDDQQACPFPHEACRTNSSNLLLDTGFINTHDHLGINAPPSERLIFRSTLQCAPLVMAGFTSSYEGRARNYTLYNYGISGPGGKYNYTYKARSLESQYSFEQGEPILADFLVVPFSSYVQNGSFEVEWTDFIPRQELRRMDADTVIVFLAGNGVSYEMPSEDEWYRATRVYTTVHGPSSDLKVYMPEEAASPMGCVQQYQFCLANEKSCGPPAGFLDAAARLFEANGLNSSDAMASAAIPVTHMALEKIDDPTVSRLQWLIALIQVPADFQMVFMSSGSQALASRTSMSRGLESILPVDQWKTDIKHAWATAFSFLQAQVVANAHGTNSPDLVKYSLKQADEAQVDLCTNQKIRSTAYASFNFFALLFTYILGLVIIGLSFSLEPLLNLLHRRLRYQSYADLEWTTNATLQTHRLAHEGIYSVDDTWSHCVDTIPTTSSAFTMAPLDISDMKHPRLARSTKELETNSPPARASLSAGLPFLPRTNSLEFQPSPTEVSSIADTVHSTEPSGSHEANNPTGIPSPESSSSSANSERRLRETPKESL